MNEEDPQPGPSIRGPNRARGRGVRDWDDRPRDPPWRRPGGTNGRDNARGRSRYRSQPYDPQPIRFRDEQIPQVIQDPYRLRRDQQEQWRGNPRRPDKNSNNVNPRENQNRRDNTGRTDGVSKDRYRNNDKSFMGFVTLEAIAHSESKEILIKLNEKRNAFFKFLDMPIDRGDVFVLIIEIIAKVCQSTFNELKLKMILDICKSNFISHLRNYLMDLPYVQSKTTNSLYWNNPNEFWKNFVTFCECIVNISPSTALQKCRSLIDGTSKSCLEGLSERHSFVLPDEYVTLMAELREKLTIFETRNEKEPPSSTKRNKIADNAFFEPPESFRQLSIVPNPEDMMDQRPFLRPNIVDGAYQDVEHYLDVQFRLLREDCFGPLREGINQYTADPHKKRYDNIRIFRNVKFVEPYISKSKTGTVIQIDVKANKVMKRINWANSKRFIFGSLVLFTKDNCKNFVVATILDRDANYLAEGKIPVSIVNMEFDDEIYKQNESYIMIESEVYFEPYQHVLKAMQDPTFPEHLAMQKYIVKVDPVPTHPAYLNENTEYIYIDGKRRVTFNENNEINELDDEYDSNSNNDTNSGGHIKYKVLQIETWPSNEELGLNQSQFEAYQLSLTHEFAVIQGPPGTGKTYLGVKIAKTLLQNLKYMDGCLMLVICYTNHALDQFLEAIMQITHSIVRIGGQSRNKALDDINLSKLRNTGISGPAHKLFMTERYNLKSAIAEFKTSLSYLDALNNGVISYRCISDEVPEIELLGSYYNTHDPLRDWLFEHSYMHAVDFQQCLLEDNNLDIPKESNEYADTRKQSMVEDDEENGDETLNEIKTSFLLNEAKVYLHNLIRYYNENANHHNYNLQNEIQDQAARIKMFNDMKTQRGRQVRIRIDQRTNFSKIRTEDRWALYFMWITEKINQVKTNITNMQANVDSANAAFEESRAMMDMRLLENTKVVGMTTSGAARMRNLLTALAPPIVIVEEAAEVLEQHIVTSLTKNCKHLILIGDHQQLRPSASHMKLAKHYNIEVSLFERMITNGIHSRRLGVQHRMRPEIAALISPHIYTALENHPDVEQFPDVLGVTKNLFFFSHDYKEEDIDDNSSRSNHKEADMTLCMANYLMQQGYTPEDITILAAYSGQMFYMRKERNNYVHLTNVKITVVDNYQGEESKIILLSLVRNNDHNKIGFLGTENRVCVALSRAREGFYLFGNIDILKNNSELWMKIATTLECSNSLGTSIQLKCQNHPEQISVVSNPEDFEKVPEGGCVLKCNFDFKCGHRCPLLCHGYDREHVTNYTKCNVKCERILCDLGHGCPLKCSDECGPCKKLMKKTLPCGHDMNVYCHLEPDDPSIKCLTIVTATLPNCGHEEKKACFVSASKVICTTPCDYRLEKCGHVCLRKCHVTNDPEHERYLCNKACARAKKGCKEEIIGDRGDHQCLKKCHEPCDDCDVKVVKRRTTCKHLEPGLCSKDINSVPCRKKCSRTMECGHFCKKLCFETCGDCKILVKKVIAGCNHEVKIMCKTEPTREQCLMKCERMLSCGHPCKQLCAKPCDDKLCSELTTQKFKSACGHLVAIPCNVYRSTPNISTSELLKYCTEPCGQTLACDHICSGTCSKCHQGRLHVACTQTCNQQNICGHQCEEPCNQVCPPCKKQCEVKCQHSRCRRLCGAPCVPCKEKCSRVCLHGSCRRRCDEPCSVAACAARCARALPCGHPCRGLCADPCPDICNLCRPDEFPTDFLGDQYEDDDVFIQLQDCKHVLELENMNNLMTGDRETVTIRCCPFCRKPIINTSRYKDLINETFKLEINPIKEKVYGTRQQIVQRLIEFETQLKKIRINHYTVLKENKHFSEKYQQLVIIAKNNKISLLDLEMRFIYLNILDMIAESCKKFYQDKLTQLKDELQSQIKMICSILIIRLPITSMKISQQQQKDVSNEIKRLNSIVQFSQILSHPQYVSSKNTPNVLKAANAATQAVFTIFVFEEDKVVEALKQLQDTVKVSGFVSKQDRQMIVQAIGLKAGHWFKCPNGHFYCIADCGGAMVESKCNECGAKIGGTSHTLLSTNSHAPEMDDSQFPAWSEQYNNMANFQF